MLMLVDSHSIAARIIGPTVMNKAARMSTAKSALRPMVKI
jgi:redox-sensitive bicupin YhaK (pirin superfamily)